MDCSSRRTTAHHDRRDGAAALDTPAHHRPDRWVVAITLAAAAFCLVAGVWCLVSPASFADAVEFPRAEHFVHDIGAFQIGLGAVLVLATIWRDPLAVVLAGFLLGNTVHAVNHAVDGDLGGRDLDPWLIGALSVLTAVALVRRLRQLGYVVGRVQPAAEDPLVPFVEQKTVILTSYTRDGRGVPSPVSIAVDGHRAFTRTYDKAWKTRRMRNNPVVEITPGTATGRPTGAPVRFRSRRLAGPESAHAAELLADKYPLLQGVVVPLSHRLGHGRFGPTVHYELTSVDGVDGHGDA